MKLVWHPLAMADRECIMDFIASDKPLAALALDENFETHADRIEANPYLYRPGRVSGTREAVVHPNYVMVYYIESETITILRITCHATLAVGQIATFPAQATAGFDARQSPRFDDWLVCMVSSRIEQAEAGFGEVL